MFGIIPWLFFTRNLFRPYDDCNSWRIAEAIEKANRKPLTKKEKKERILENRAIVVERLAEAKRKIINLDLTPLMVRGVNLVPKGAVSKEK